MKNTIRNWLLGFLFIGLIAIALPQSAAENRIELTLTNGETVLHFPLLPHIETFDLRISTNIDTGFKHEEAGEIKGHILRGKPRYPMELYRLQSIPVLSNRLLTATLLNRLAYGATPDELERVQKIGPQAYIDEQLSPETIEDEPDLDTCAIITNGWEYVTFTGAATSSELLITLGEAGAAYLDDITLVKGSVPGDGPNLLRNGDFQQPLNTNYWTFGRNFTQTTVVQTNAHSGGTLLVIAQDSGSQLDAARCLIETTLVKNEIYTLSYWYYRDAKRPNKLFMFLAGSGPGIGIFSSPDDRLSLNTKVTQGFASPSDLRAWHVLRAVRSKRQLLEVLLRFVDNHFVTAIIKCQEFYGFVYNGPEMINRASTEAESKQLDRWRVALLKPQCTFHDLLKISAESPAMLMYLDTVYSRGVGALSPNENYSRELLELFTFGVDNGYDQEDVVEMSRVWTGWAVNIVDPGNEQNPLSPASTTFFPGARTREYRNLLGVWSFSFIADWHDPRAKLLFRNKIVPPRFGPPYAGRNYELRLPPRAGKEGIQDGYDVVSHLANQPFTQEFICVKLCRLFVHEDFQVGYDFTSPALSPEARLVRNCMDVWEWSEPKGQIRKIVQVIFDSDLFRTELAASQKIKNPLEFTVSCLRALRSENSDGTFTAETDGYSLEGPMERMGAMSLFDRSQPDGFPEAGAPWISSGTVAERIRFVYACLAPLDGHRPPEGGENRADPVALVKKKLPSGSWTAAPALVDYFLSIFYPAEGKANLNEYRSLAIDFLNSDDEGIESPFNALSPKGVVYDMRVRGMVALLLSLQRFQEQ